MLGVGTTTGRKDQPHAEGFNLLLLKRELGRRLKFEEVQIAGPA